MARAARIGAEAPVAVALSAAVSKTPEPKLSTNCTSKSVASACMRRLCEAPPTWRVPGRREVPAQHRDRLVGAIPLALADEGFRRPFLGPIGRDSWDPLGTRTFATVRGAVLDYARDPRPKRHDHARSFKSGRLDLNQRPFGPQPNALFV